MQRQGTHTGQGKQRTPWSGLLQGAAGEKQQKTEDSMVYLRATFSADGGVETGSGAQNRSCTSRCPLIPRRVWAHASRLAKATERTCVARVRAASWALQQMLAHILQHTAFFHQPRVQRQGFGQGGVQPETVQCVRMRQLVLAGRCVNALDGTLLRDALLQSVAPEPGETTHDLGHRYVRRGCGNSRG